ncbi:MAG: DUF99 family protein [Candidatus Aenigmatarchaeota archaeon]
MRFGNVKGEIRILAWDDGPFEHKGKGTVPMIGVVYRGGKLLDGILRIDVEIDGTDAEAKIIQATNKTKHRGQVRVLMLDGITFGGFNTVNIRNINEKTGLPVIVLLRKKPGFDAFKSAIAKLPHSSERLACVEAAGPIYYTSVKSGRLAFQVAGIDRKDAEQVIVTSTVLGNVPEPLRAAHLIATGIVRGESIGRA